MKTLFTFGAFVCLLLSSLQPDQPDGWKGIVPLHSTRRDVERLLGPSSEKCKCFYETEDEKIFVEYSQSPCKGFLTGWNVATDTVLMLTVRPNREIRLSDLAVDLTKFEESTGSDTPGLSYTDKNGGVRYRIREGGIVESVNYMPRRADYSLRCKGFPAPDLGHREFNPFDTYSNIRFSNERARLDNFSIWLRKQPEMRGHIVVYASKDFPPSRAKKRAQRAKDYLTKVRGLDPERIGIVEGGYREQFQIELYILPANVGPPNPHS